MKKNKTFQKVSIIVGLLLMLISFLLYKLNVTGFLAEVHSEIFGVGVAVFMVGLVWYLFKIKLE